MTGDPLLMFAPIHKRAFGVAVGVVLGALVFGMTVLTTFFPAERQWPLGLLSQYFAGYSISLPGALIGFGWGAFVGYVAGWFLAFCRNLVIAVQLWVGKTREELARTRDFLDHI